MRKIYVLDDDKNLQEVDAGATSYAELSDLPIAVKTLNTTVTIEDGQIKLTPAEGHKWTKEELNDFCGVLKADSDNKKQGEFDYSINVQDGRYDIETEERGHEILIIDTVTVDQGTVRQCRRITSQYDWVYSEQAKAWVSISDTSAGALIFSWETPPANITKGTNVVLKYNYYSATGKIGTVQCLVNNNLKVTTSHNSSSEAYSLDITNFLTTGDNTVLLKVTAGDATSELFAHINVIDLVLSSPFTENELYEGDTLKYIYSLSGSVEKTVYFQFDDRPPTSHGYAKEANATNVPEMLDTTELSHGIHKLTVWAEAVIGASNIKTETFVYNVPIWKSEEKGTIIAIHSYPAELEQGATAFVAYTAYHSTKTSVPISLGFPAEFNMESIVMDIPTGEKQNWSFVTPSGAEYLGSFDFTITSEKTIASFSIKVVQGQNIEYEKDNLLYELQLIGMSNNLPNKEIIKYTTIEKKPQEAVAKVENFNFVNDGWLNSAEEEDRNMLRINATSKVTYNNMNLFTLLDGANSVGCTFDIDFLGRNTTNSNRALIRLSTDSQQNNGEGIFVKEQSVDVNIAGSIYKVEYKAGERTRVTVTIGPDKEGERRVMIYVNGVLSYVSEYASAGNFGTKKTPLILNPNFGFVDIYGLRIYGAALNMRQVLRNYIASYNTSPEKVAQRNWNDIYVEGGDEISYDKVKKLMPTFVFTTNSVNAEQNMPPKKKEKRYGPVDYIDPIYSLPFNEDYNADKEKPVADVQGTSSQKYPRKNFKIKTNKKHSMNPAIVGEKVFTFKKDFMDSSHANNTGLAKLVQTLYTTPVPPQISYVQYTTGAVDSEGETIYKDVYDIEGNRIDYVYIYNDIQSQPKPDSFPSMDKMFIEVRLLTEEVEGTPHYYVQYNKVGNSTTYKIKNEIKHEPDEILTELKIKDKSYVRTTVFGQPCAFFWVPTDPQTGQTLPPVYQGIYNFNTDKVSTENMELENEGCLSFEFANNVSDGAVFKACDNFTEIHNSFEFRAYEKEGVNIATWEDYYDDDLTKWANGGYDEKEKYNCPILNALYNIDLSKSTDVESTLTLIAGEQGLEAYCKAKGYVMPPDSVKEIACRIIGKGYDRMIEWRNISDTEKHITWYPMCNVMDLIGSLSEETKATLTKDDVYASVAGTTVNWQYVVKRTQLFVKKGEQELPINYPYLVKNIYETGVPGDDSNPPKGGFAGESPEMVEAQYQLTPEGTIQVSHVDSKALSDEMKISETIAAFEAAKGMKPDEYYTWDPVEKPDGFRKSPDVDVSTPLVCDIINQEADYLVRWGYDTEGGDAKEWFYLCKVGDLLATLDPEMQEKVNQVDVQVKLKKGTAGTINWFFSYPVTVKWFDILKEGESISDSTGAPVKLNKLEKFDMYELMHQPIKDVVNWVIDCYKDYEQTNSIVKFTSEIDKHVNLDYTLTYYVMALMAGAADSLAKNMFWNSYDGGETWYPVWYDIDTCFGLSNDGHPNFPYSLEMYGEGSKLGTADIYNGAKSNFWKLVYAAYPTEITQRYKDLRRERLTYDSVMEVLYNQQISKIAPSHFNEDARFCYLPFPAYYYTAQGSRYERLKYWVENRFYYLDSKFEDTQYIDDSYELRTNAGLPIEVTTDMDIYVGNKFGQHVEKMNKKRCLANHTVSFDPKDYNIKNMNDLETLIYGASHIISLGNLADHQITSIKFPTKTESVLENLIIGKEDKDYTNTNFTTLTVGKNSVLKVLNVSNCINLGKESASLDLTGCPSIQTVLAKNTKLTNIMIPDGSPIRQMHLPKIRSLRLVNQILLSDFTVDSFEDLNSLIWENVPKSSIPVEEILNTCYKQGNNNILTTIRVIGINNEKAFDTAWLDWVITKSGIDDIGGSTELPYITGNLKVQGLDKEVLIPYIKIFRQLGENFCYVTTYNNEDHTTHKWKLISTDELDTFEEILDDSELKQYKLNLVLEQIVAEENIFGVSGEGR